MRKIIQLVMNDQVLVALCDDGVVFRLSNQGDCWLQLPDIFKSEPYQYKFNGKSLEVVRNA